MILLCRSYVLFLILVISGCASSSERASSGQELYAAVIAGSISGEDLGESQGALWIDNEEALISFMGKINRVRIGAASPDIPVMDYDREGVLAIWMGRRTTGGYKLELATDRVSVREMTAIVRVRWIEPAGDAILTQRITGPCLLIRMPRGDYSRIRVMDESGIVRAKTDVEKPENR